MTSFPIPQIGCEASLVLTPGRGNSIGGTNVEDERFLLRAFRSFSEAASSLERSYGKLRTEVHGLRLELEERNRDLARSLEENRSMRAHLDRIVEGLPCGVLVVESDGRITRANSAALRLIGMEGACPQFSSLRGAVQELLVRAENENGEPESSLPDPQGSTRWLAARHASIDDRSRPASIFILEDVTERKRWEEAQGRMRRDQALAEISTLLAHEIRNPLGSLELFAGLLADAPLDEECQQWVEHVQAGLRILSATVNNVLHFHSLPDPQRSSVDVGGLLEWAGQFFLPLAHQSNVTLSVRHDVRGVSILADRHRLEQVLLNLVLNSVRAMPQGGSIELGGHLVDPKWVELVVSDTGPGISHRDLPKLFEPGFTTQPGSSGLGLAVCRKIVERHGGTISAESELGRGARFAMRFPSAPEAKEGASR